MIANPIAAIGPQAEGEIRVDSQRISELPAERATDEEVLDAVAAMIRKDVLDDPIFYLVRSNTSCDGE